MVHGKDEGQSMRGLGGVQWFISSNNTKFRTGLELCRSFFFLVLHKYVLCSNSNRKRGLVQCRAA